MSRQIKGIHEEDDKGKGELKFIHKVNDDTFPYRIKDISIDGRIIIIIIKNGLQNGMETRGRGHVVVINLQVPDNTWNFLTS